MSVIDTMRTAQPSVASPVKAAPDAGGETLRAALQNAAITIPQLLRQRAAMHGEELALREKEYGIWNPYSWRHYYETARAVALGLHEAHFFSRNFWIRAFASGRACSLRNSSTSAASPAG